MFDKKACQLLQSNSCANYINRLKLLIILILILFLSKSPVTKIRYSRFFIIDFQILIFNY